MLSQDGWFVQPENGRVRGPWAAAPGLRMRIIEILGVPTGAESSSESNDAGVGAPKISNIFG
jgi:hypothetical protein